MIVCVYIYIYTYKYTHADTVYTWVANDFILSSHGGIHEPGSLSRLEGLVDGITRFHRGMMHVNWPEKGWKANHGKPENPWFWEWTPLFSVSIFPGTNPLMNRILLQKSSHHHGAFLVCCGSSPAKIPTVLRFEPWALYSSRCQWVAWLKLMPSQDCLVSTFKSYSENGDL